MKLLCYGDSNTYGFDPRDGGRYPKDGRWPELLGALLGIEVCNEGLNGRTIPFGERSFQLLKSMLARHKDCDLCTVMLGTNDIFHVWEPTAGRIARRMKALFENVPELLSWQGGKRRVILLAPPPLLLPQITENAAYLEAAGGLSEAYRQIAEELGLEFFDTAGLAPRMAFDGVHLTEEGNRHLAESLQASFFGRG